MIIFCTHLFKTHILQSLEVFKRRFGLTYHEVIRCRSLFGVSPHTEKRDPSILKPDTIKTVFLSAHEMFFILTSNSCQILFIN